MGARIRSTVTTRTRACAVGVVRHSVLAELAHRTRISTDDLKHHVGASSSQAIHSLRSRVDMETSQVFDGLFKRMYLCRQAWVLFVAAHPFTGILSFSIFITRFRQSSLVASQLLGAAALSAVFFSASGDVLSIASAAECDTEDNIWRSATVGIFSALVTSIPLIFVAAAMKRYFVLRECWDERAKRRQLRRWRHKDRFIWALCLIYNIVCTLFVATFLANIRPEDAQKWLDSLVGIFFEDFLLQPMVVAIIYTLITAALLVRSPGLLEEVRNDLRILDNDATTLASTEQLAISSTAPSLLLNMEMKRSRSVNGDAPASEICLDVADETNHMIRTFPRSAWSVQTQRSHSVLNTGVSDSSGTVPCLNSSTTHASSPAPVSLNADSRVPEIRLDADGASHQSSAGQQQSRSNSGTPLNKSSFV